jgi:hypothetical protein
MDAPLLVTGRHSLQPAALEPSRARPAPLDPPRSTRAALDPPRSTRAARDDSGSFASADPCNLHDGHQVNAMAAPTAFDHAA